MVIMSKEIMQIVRVLLTNDEYDGYSGHEYINLNYNHLYLARYSSH